MMRSPAFLSVLLPSLAAKALSEDKKRIKQGKQRRLEGHPSMLVVLCHSRLFRNEWNTSFHTLDLSLGHTLLSVSTDEEVSLPELSSLSR